MDARSLRFVVDACEGELLGGLAETLVSRVCTDSPRVQPGDLFIALAGEKFDAHDYLAEVARKGAAALVVAPARAGQAPSLSHSIGVIAVDDTRLALGKLAASYRSDFNLPVVAIAGSNG